MKKILGIYSGGRQRRSSGDLLARTLFSQRTLGRHVSPFLLLDQLESGAAPSGAASAAQVESHSGCKKHASRHCKVLTMVYQGEVEHVDAAGRKRIIGAGDVQWQAMVGGQDEADDASAGIFQASSSAGRRNGAVGMIQLWIDLPSSPATHCRASKIIAAKNIPAIRLPENGGMMRVVAGPSHQSRGAMPTASPCDIRELQLRSRCVNELKAAAGRTLLLAILDGSVLINGDQTARSGEVVMFDRPGEDLFLETYAATTALLLSGEPIESIEPEAGR